MESRVFRLASQELPQEFEAAIFTRGCQEGSLDHGDLSVAEELEPESAALGLKSLWEVDV